MSKKIILNNEELILINNNDLSIVTNEEDNLNIDDFDFDENAKDVYLLDDRLIYSSENSLFTFNLGDGQINKIMDIEDKKISVSKKKIYLASFIDGKLNFEIYDSSFNLIEKKLYTEFEETISEFNSDYPIMVDLWDDDDEYSSLKSIINGFTIEDELFVISVNSNLYFGDFDKKIVKHIEIPQTFGMDVDLFLRKPSLTLHGKDKEVSLDFTITQLPFRKKRRGGIEKLEVKLLKRGVDKITPSVSKNGELWFGSEGEEEIYPIIINLKKIEPIVVFDEAINDNYAITANEDLTALFVTDFESELKKYEWTDEGIFLDYVVDLKE